jgi:hypothetical protein
MMNNWNTAKERNIAARERFNAAAMEAAAAIATTGQTFRVYLPPTLPCYHRVSGLREVTYRSPVGRLDRTRWICHHTCRTHGEFFLPVPDPSQHWAATLARVDSDTEIILGYAVADKIVAEWEGQQAGNSRFAGLFTPN